jgi:glycerol-3-phosphate acyltransferase PlsY
MAEFYPILLLTFLAYFIGSIPSAVWIGKYVYDLDVRDFGSGNAGSTNTYRVLGARAGIYVQILDILKGFLAASLAGIFYRNFGFFNSHYFALLRLVFGLAAVVGHIYPIFAEMRGGKGINTLLGMMIAVHPWATLVCVLVFILVLMKWKYVSLGSILATLAFPLFLIVTILFFSANPDPVLVGFGFIIFILVVYTHRLNIQRLLRGEESKATLSFLKRKKE